jgi:hypothetical protein
LLPSPPLQNAQKTKLGLSSRASPGHRKPPNAQGYLKKEKIKKEK